MNEFDTTRAMVARNAEDTMHSRIEKITEMMIARRSEFEDVLQKVISADRFTRLAFGAFRKTPLLQQCTDVSIVSALMDVAVMGLEPNTPAGEAFLIPYKNKTGGYDCTLIIGYQGILKLLYETGNIRDVTAKEVCENDDFEYTDGTSRSIVHKYSVAKARGEVIGYYAVIRTVDGGEFIEYMSVAEVAAIEARAMARTFSAWKTDREMMGRKTVLKKCTKYTPKFSFQLKRAVEIEEESNATNNEEQSNDNVSA